MDPVDNKIFKEWIDVRDRLSTPVKMKAHLKLDDKQVGPLQDELRGATMTGVVEWKRKAAGSVFNFLTRLEFTTPNQAEIMDAEAHIRVQLFVISLQTIFSTGQMKPAKEAEGPLASANGKTRPSIEELVSEVKARVSTKPELAKNPHVKNIFMEIQLYQKEFAQFSALSPTIPDERAPTFFANYKKRLDGILDNVHAHFRDIRLAEDDELRKEFARVEEDLFVAPELTKLLASQAQELQKVRTSIFHALQEYKVRDALLKLVNLREPVLALFEEELKFLDSRQDRASTGHPAAVKFARSLASALESNAWKKSG